MPAGQFMIGAHCVACATFTRTIAARKAFARNLEKGFATEMLPMISLPRQRAARAATAVDLSKSAQQSDARRPYDDQKSACNWRGLRPSLWRTSLAQAGRSQFRRLRPLRLVQVDSARRLNPYWIGVKTRP
jgi:hypothetical protein